MAALYEFLYYIYRHYYIIYFFYGSFCFVRYNYNTIVWKNGTKIIRIISPILVKLAHII